MKLLYNQFDLGIDPVTDNDCMSVRVNNTLFDLSVKSTQLHRGCMSDITELSQDCVYIFAQGSGVMQVDDQRFRVGAGSVVLCPMGSQHQIVNDGDMFLVFNCVVSSNVL